MGNMHLSVLEEIIVSLLFILYISKYMHGNIFIKNLAYRYNNCEHSTSFKFRYIFHLFHFYPHRSLHQTSVGIQ